MKSLVEIYQTYKLAEHGISDKGTTHSYIEQYEKLFEPFRQRQPINMLEIGLARGGSLRMWREYFDKSKVYGIDIAARPEGVPDLLKLMEEKLSRMSISIMDARSPFQAMHHLGTTRFDIIIEDASHTIPDSLDIYANFIHRLNPDGLYIIEDVADIEAALPKFESLIRPRPFEVMDFRKQKTRFDDVLVVVR